MIIGFYKVLIELEVVQKYCNLLWNIVQLERYLFYGIVEKFPTARKQDDFGANVELIN